MKNTKLPLPANQWFFWKNYWYILPWWPSTRPLGLQTELRSMDGLGWAASGDDGFRVHTAALQIPEILILLSEGGSKFFRGESIEPSFLPHTHWSIWSIVYKFKGHRSLENRIDRLNFEDSKKSLYFNNENT